MQKPQTPILAMDQVMEIVRHGNLAKTVNKLRTVPGEPNPFVIAQSNTSNASSPTSQGNTQQK